MKDKLQAKPESFGDLEKMILAKRNNAFGGFLNYMEDKYANEENLSGKKRKLPKGEATEGKKKRKLNWTLIN